MAQPATEYRPHIDGLRAFSVLSVVIFHAWPKVLPGGFIGVDVFFVISGFLISRIILNSLQRGAFSYADFYSRRVRRIFPALSVVLLVFLAAGWLFFFQRDWNLLGKHTTAGAAFLSNIVSLREAAAGRGYFDPDITQTRPLLHLWSLGIEEQFYIVWPPLLALLWKRRGAVLPGILLVLAASFALNTWFIATRTSDVFYFPLTRFWELAIGATLAWMDLFLPAVKRNAEVNALAGAALLITAVLTLNERTAFPGVWALLPTLGAALVLQAGSQSWLNRVVLSSRPLVFFGLISYPLYLWHWPALYFMRILGPDYPTAFSIGAAVALSVLAAWLTYALLEKHVRHHRSPLAPWALAGAMTLLAAIGFFASSNRLPARLESGGYEGVAAVKAALSDWDYPYKYNFKLAQGFRSGTLPGIREGRVVIIGDSHAEQYYARVKTLTSIPPVTFVTHGGCPSLPGLNALEPGYHCDRFLDFALAQARAADVRAVVFSSYWEVYFGYELGGNRRSQMYCVSGNPVPADQPCIDKTIGGFGEMMRALVGSGRKVYVILSNPESRSYDPRRMLSLVTGQLQPRAVPRAALTESAPILDSIRRAAEAAGATVIDPVPEFCEVSTCATTEAGQPLFRDSDHMRSSTAARRAGYIDPIFR